MCMSGKQAPGRQRREAKKEPERSEERAGEERIMNNIEIARQTMKITKERAYEIGGRRVELPEMDFRAVEIFSPKAGKELLMLMK